MSRPPIAVLPLRGARDFFVDTAARRADLFRVVDELPPPGEPTVIVVPAILGRMVDMLTELLTEPPVTAALRERAIIAFDHSMEGPGLPRHIMQPLHDALARAGVKPGRIAYISQNHQFAADYAQWAQEAGIGCGEGDRLRILHHHFHVGVVARQASQPVAGRDGSLPPAAAIAARPFRYLCLNNKFKDFRAIVLGHLVRSGLMDSGVVSFREAAGHEPLDRQKVLEKGRQRFPRFAAEFDAFEGIFDRLPLVLDTASHFRQLVFGPTPDLFSSASFMFVTESEMSMRNVLRLTEKTIKPFSAGQLALVAGNAGTLGLVRELGFATFAPLVDEAYDRIAHPEARLQAVLGEFTRLATMPRPWLERLIADLHPVLEHNLRHAGSGLAARVAAIEDSLALAIWRALAPPA